MKRRMKTRAAIAAAIVMPIGIGISLLASADQYPGDKAYNAILQMIRNGIDSNQITFKNSDGSTTVMSRSQLCKKLSDRHNGQTPGGNADNQTNGDFLGKEMTEEMCANALDPSSQDGYDGPDGWQMWAGDHDGTWYNDDGTTWPDSADWQDPTKVTGTSATDVEPEGRTPKQNKPLFSRSVAEVIVETPDPDTGLPVPREYDFQKVVFAEHDTRTGDARFGWNQSHPDVPYVWGWDPKDNDDEGGEEGAHIGFTFQAEGCKCIVWVTKKEAFLECVTTGNTTPKKRTSTGLWGVGQWTVN